MPLILILVVPYESMTFSGHFAKEKVSTIFVFLFKTGRGKKVGSAGKNPKRGKIAICSYHGAIYLDFYGTI